METSLKTMEVVVCPTCRGDARASVACSMCHGAGMHTPSQFGSLIWSLSLDEAFFAFRRLRQKLNTIVHVVLLIAVLTSFAFFIGGLALLLTGETSQEFSLFPTWLLSPSFWTSGRWFVCAFWLGVFLACVLFYRLKTSQDAPKLLPNWSPRARQAQQEKTGALEVSSFIDVAVWSVLEQAYGFARSLNRTEVTQAHLFAAALASPAGGIFLTRLGVDFDKLKPALVDVLRQGTPGGPPVFSLAAKQVLIQAFLAATDDHHRFVSVADVFLASFNADEGLQEALDASGYPPEHVRHVVEWLRLQDRLREERDRFCELASLKPKTIMNRAMTAQQTPLLDAFSEDLTLLARNGYIGPIVGRDREMEELLRGIETGQQSVVLIGESGTGKTALVESLARRMVEEDVPPELFDRRLVSIHVAQLVAGGDTSTVMNRLLQLLGEVAMSGNVILVIHGLETLVGGTVGASLDLAETLASELDRGYFTLIATTTPRAWTSYLERRSLSTKLVRVDVREMEKTDAIRVLMLQSGYIEFKEKVFFSYAALEKAADLAGRYLRDLRLPESAIGVIKEAAVFARKERGEGVFVTAEDVAKIIHDKTAIPVEAVTRNESEKLLDLEAGLHKRVIGQEDAVTAVAQAMRRARAEVRERKRPIANFLFMGPTGVGKTELAKALAAEYFGSEEAMVRLDMSEYQDASAIARVIGAPGDERGGWLTEAVRKKPFTIVLLDELEKAHPDILTLFLQVMDDGRLTDGVGRTVDFTNTVLIATSNAGTGFIQESIKADLPIEQIKTALLERELKGVFRPEFLNRFDAVIVFRPLTMDDVTQIAWLFINGLAKRMEEKGIIFRAEDEAVEELAKIGFDPLFGARPLRRTIQEKVENALADVLLRGGVGRRDTITLLPDGKLRVDKAGHGG